MTVQEITADFAPLNLMDVERNVADVLEECCSPKSKPVVAYLPRLLSPGCIFVAADNEQKNAWSLMEMETLAHKQPIQVLAHICRPAEVQNCGEKWPGIGARC